MARLTSRKQSMRLRRRGRGQTVRHSRALDQETVAPAPSYLGPYLVTRAIPVLEEVPETLPNGGSKQGQQMGVSESRRERTRKKRKERRKRGMTSHKTNNTKESEAVEFAGGAENDGGAGDENDWGYNIDYTIDNDAEDEGYEDYESENDINFVFEKTGEYDDSDDVETDYEDDGPEEDDEDSELDNFETDQEDDEDEDEEDGEDGEDGDIEEEDVEDDESESYPNDQEMEDDDGMIYDDASGELIPRQTRSGRWYREYFRKQQRRQEKRDEEDYGTLPF